MTIISNHFKQNNNINQQTTMMATMTKRTMNRQQIDWREWITQPPRWTMAGNNGHGMNAHQQMALVSLPLFLITSWPTAAQWAKIVIDQLISPITMITQPTPILVATGQTFHYLHNQNHLPWTITTYPAFKHQHLPFVKVPWHALQWFSIINAVLLQPRVLPPKFKPSSKMEGTTIH